MKVMYKQILVTGFILLGLLGILIISIPKEPLDCMMKAFIPYFAVGALTNTETRKETDRLSSFTGLSSLELIFYMIRHTFRCFLKV